jgi:hypothetical protein
VSQAPTEAAVDPVAEEIVSQALTWDGTSMVPGGDLEWQQIVPFLRGWALMVPDVRVESASRSRVVNEPENPGVVSIVLVSTVGPGRATVTVGPEPDMGTTISSTPHMSLSEITAHGHFMQRVGEAGERLQTFLRAHLVGVAEGLR